MVHVSGLLVPVEVTVPYVGKEGKSLTDPVPSIYFIHYKCPLLFVCSLFNDAFSVSQTI
jgi:hypothetical protein